MAYNALRAKYGYPPSMSDEDVVRTTRARPEFAHESNQDFAAGVDAYEAQRAQPPEATAAQAGGAAGMSAIGGPAALGAAIGPALLGAGKAIASDVGAVLGQPIGAVQQIARVAANLPKIGQPGFSKAILPTPEEMARQRQAGAAEAGLVMPFPGMIGAAEKAIPAAVNPVAKRLIAGGLAGAPAGALDALLRGGATPGSVGASSAVGAILGGLTHGVLGRVPAGTRAAEEIAATPAYAGEIAVPPEATSERALAQMHEAEGVGFPVGKHEPLHQQPRVAAPGPEDESLAQLDRDLAAVPEPPPGHAVAPNILNAEGAVPSAVQLLTKTSALLRARGPEAAQAADLLEQELHTGIRRVGAAEQHFHESGLFDLPIGQRLQLDRAYRMQDPSGLNPAQRAAYDAIAPYMKGVQQEVLTANEGRPVMLRNPQTGVRDIPFPSADRPGYLPRYFDPKAALREGPVRQSILWNMKNSFGYGNDAPQVLDDAANFMLGRRGFGNLAAQRMVDKGQANSVDEALAMLRRVKSGVQRAGSIEFARSVPNTPYYDPDVARAIGKYVHTVEPRLAQIQTLGQDQQVLNRALARIPDETMREDATRLADVALEKRDQALSGTQKIAGGLRSAAVLRFGPWTTLANATQQLNTGLASDVGPLVLGVRQAMTKEGDRIARESGAVSGAAMHHYLDIAGGGKGGWTDAYLNAIGFTPVERANRRVAANVGYQMAKKFVGRLLKDPGDTRAAFELKLLNVDPAKVLREGRFTDDMGLDGALKFSSNTQFRSAPLDLPPEATRTEVGKMIAQFKAFAYQQTDLLQRELVGRLKAGQVKRVLRNAVILGTAFPAVGAGVNRIQNFFQGRPQPKDLVQETVGGLQKSAAGGLPGNVAQAISLGLRERTPAPLLEEIGAPVAGMGAEAAMGLAGRATGQPMSAYDKARGLSYIPGVGSVVAPWLSPYGQVGSSGLPQILREHGVPLPQAQKAKRGRRKK